MIHVTATPIPTAQVTTLRDWLRQPGAELFRHILVSNIAALQAGAGQNLIEARDQKNRQDQDANEQTDDAQVLVHTLAILEEFRTSDDRLISVSLAIDAPAKIAETT